MRLRLLFILFLFPGFKIFAQQRFVSFDTAIPTNWVATNISLTKEHIKGGANALKWNTSSGQKLTVSNINIQSSEIGNYSASSAQFNIYSNTVSNDTLVFTFYDTSGSLKREGRILLNYKGWREYHRSYRYDYNNGEELSAFALGKMEVLYKPASSGSRSIYFDEMTFVGNTEGRMPGTHMLLDYQHYKNTSEYNNAIYSWVHQADMMLIPPTTDELAGIQQIKNQYLRNLTTVNGTAVQAAKTYVNNCGINRNPDHSINGRGMAITDTDTLMLISNHFSALARAYAVNNDADALNKLNLFAEYALDQGLAEGGRNVMPYNNYNLSRMFPIGFLEALPYLNNVVRTEIVKMLKWSVEFNKIYEANPIAGLNTDFMHVKSNFLLELALAGSSNEEITRDLKSFGRYMEKFTFPGEGGRDGIKPDGTGFHHGSQHISYLYAYGTWVNRAFELKGTPFKISSVAYENMSFGLRTLFLETSKGTIYPNSASGRSPFQNGVPVNALAMERMVQVGGDIYGVAFETQMAAFYNYIFKVNKYAVAPKDWDAYYQFNYGQTGLRRKDNWLAVTRGLTDRLFGSEIYANDNRYGRYQSYGSLEVLYDGSLASTGYIAGGAGWDWNMMPGTTSVRQSYTNLKPLIPGTASEYQGDAFAGALAEGNNGVFGMNFIQNAGSKYTTSNLKFRKSVFTFDSVMVCLGSTISASNSTDQVITTLFQAVNANANPSIYINSATATNANYDQAVSTTNNGVWLVNAQTTGYYIPKGNGDVNVFRGSQTTPINTTDDVNATATANVSKAWLSHGIQPTSSKYQFVVVPATTPQKMTALSSKIDNKELYEVLKQTDSVHAVKNIPENKIMYSCFVGQANINVGHVTGVSGRSLLSVTEKGDSLIVKIANPDLNAVTNTESAWVSSVNQVMVSINGNWRVVENTYNAGISNQENLLEANFSLKDGFSQTLVLVNSNLTEEENAGAWDTQTHQWVYNVTTGTGLNTYGNPPTFQQGSPIVNGTIYSHSMSTASSPGFLPYPPSGTSRVHIVNSTGTSNGTIVLNSNGTLRMSASAVSGINKVSAYSIAQATPVASMFFTVSFNSTPNNGTFIWAIGKRGASSNTFSNANSVYRATPELFAALQWEITASGINLGFRESANTNGGVYKLISNSAFKKGENYDVEIYCNNSTGIKTYSRNGESYELPAGKLNIWLRPHGKLVRASRLIYNSSANIGASGEMANDVELNSYLFQGSGSTLPGANAAEITLANMEMNYAENDNLPITMLSFQGKKNNNSVLLNWVSANEKNTAAFALYRSIDGLNFEKISTIDAAGNSSQTLNYSFADHQLPLNTSEIYYKLVLLDKDGVLSYDHTISVKLLLAQENDVILFPNPVDKTANISFISSQPDLIKVLLTDLSGKILFSGLNNIVQGENRFSINVSDLAIGTYIIVLNGHTNNKQIKFIKQ